jgi:zinc/manganese transport system permease protein
MTWRDFLDLLPLFWPSLMIAGALAVSGSVIGTFVLLRREGLLALAIPQAVAAGGAVAMAYHWHAKVPSALVALALTLALLAWARLRRLEQYLLPCVYIGGLCLSFLVIAGAGQHLSDLQALFTGIDVAVDPADAQLATPLLLLAAIVAAALWRRWLLLAQSPTTAQLASPGPVVWELLYLCLLGLVVLMGTQKMGVVMVLSLLFLPGATALPWARRVPPAMALAAVIALADVAIGFYLSNRKDWPFSQSVGGVGFTLFLISHIASLVRRA